MREYLDRGIPSQWVSQQPWIGQFAEHDSSLIGRASSSEAESREVQSPEYASSDSAAMPLRLASDTICGGCLFQTYGSRTGFVTLFNTARLDTSDPLLVALDAEIGAQEFFDGWLCF